MTFLKQAMQTIHRKVFTIVSVLIISFSSNTLSAEEYETGIGIRLGGVTQGVSVKHFLSTNSALEGILSFGRHSFLITGLYEKQTAISGAEGLYWFYGGGAHIGFYRDSYYYYYYKKHGPYYYEKYKSTTVVGIDLILGMEYKFQKAPITLGLDIKPAFDFLNEFPGYVDGALTARFAF